MFQNARLKLTSWYLLIIMLISILFSLVIYASINQELNRFEIGVRERAQERIFFGFPENESTPDPMLLAVETSRQRVILTLIIVNLMIFILAGGAGYFLAGLTLRPIQEMVDEQHRFISDASHELRTPLTALRSEIEVALRSRTLRLSEARELLESNLEEVVSLQTLSDSLLQLTRSKALPEPHQTIPLHDVLAQAVKAVTAEAKKKKIAIVLPETAVTIHGDPIRLTQLFVILLDNAIKYSSEGKNVTIGIKEKEKQIEVSIADEGMGIEEREIPHIFDRFYRSDIARSKQTGGYGLGLAIAKKIVDDHKGAIIVKSAPEKGTTVQVVLPC